MAVDFICIGAQKAATTWLYQNLKSHPEIYLTPIKEIHYFDTLGIKQNIIRKLFNNNQENVRWRNQLRRRCKSYFKTKKNQDLIKHLKWDFNYFLRNRTDSWYENLFHNKEEKISGEITPAYSTLSKYEVEKIYNLFPNLKIILIIRNPVERISSQIKMMLKRRLIDNSYSSLKQYAFSDECILRSSYLRTLNTWMEFYSDQLFIGFYDEILNEPFHFLIEICEFLGVSQFNKTEANLNKIFSSEINFNLPEKLIIELYEYFFQDLIALNQRFGSHTDRWFKDAKHLISTHSKLSKH